MLWALIISTTYLIICKLIFPPINATQIVSIVQGHGFKSEHVKLEDIAPSAKLAAIASEDQLFAEHGGFDWKSIEKSLKPKSTKRKKLRGAGASTISQQVAKNVFLWQGSGIGKYLRKIPELYFTKMIEVVWGKERILEVYLNEAEMGAGIFGIEAAAHNYFNKSAKNLTKNESAMIIASLPNPKIYTVKPVSRWVRWKSNFIMRQMNILDDDPEIRKLIYGNSDLKK